MWTRRFRFTNEVNRKVKSTMRSREYLESVDFGGGFGWYVDAIPPRLRRVLRVVVEGPKKNTLRMEGASWSFCVPITLGSGRVRLDIQVFDFQRVVLDELTAWLDLFTHQQ